MCRHFGIVYLTPIGAIMHAVSESRRKRELLIADISTHKPVMPESDHPSRAHMLCYVVHEQYWEFNKCICFWLCIQLIIAGFPGGAVWLIQHAPFMAAWYPPILWAVLVSDFVIFICLWALLLAAVSPYGPTNLSFVLILGYGAKAGALVRMVKQSLPRAQDTADRQAQQWEFARKSLKILARREAMTRMHEAIFSFLVSILVLSCISFIMSTDAIDSPLLCADKVSVNASGGILQHIYFFFITFATIGYGDMSFVHNAKGHLAGIFCAGLVMLTGYGVVSYLNYYVVNFKERLLSGFEGVAGRFDGDGTPSWLWQSLRDI